MRGFTSRNAKGSIDRSERSDLDVNLGMVEVWQGASKSVVRDCLEKKAGKRRWSRRRSRDMGVTICASV